LEPVKQSLIQAAGDAKNTVVIISADALASHQSVMTVMEAAKSAGLSQVTFAAQQSQ
jgi:biopolymer transport protein ExbD